MVRTELPPRPLTVLSPARQLPSHYLFARPPTALSPLFCCLFPQPFAILAYLCVDGALCANKQNVSHSPRPIMVSPPVVNPVPANSELLGPLGSAAGQSVLLVTQAR